MASEAETKLKNEQEEFENVLEILQKQLLDASVHFDIWERLWPTEQVVDIINQYKGFFLPTRDAHLDRFILKVSDILSNDQKSPSFYRVLGMISKNSDLAPDINVREIKNRLKNHRAVLEGIKDFRNKRIAHWDTTTPKTKSVLYGDSKRLLKELKGIFNEISASHSGNIFSFRYSQQGNTDSLLEALKKKRAQDQKLIEHLKNKALLPKD